MRIVFKSYAPSITKLQNFMKSKPTIKPKNILIKKHESILIDIEGVDYNLNKNLLSKLDFNAINKEIGNF